MKPILLALLVAPMVALAAVPKLKNVEAAEQYATKRGIELTERSEFKGPSISERVFNYRANGTAVLRILQFSSAVEAANWSKLIAALPGASSEIVVLAGPIAFVINEGSAEDRRQIQDALRGELDPAVMKAMAMRAAEQRTAKAREFEEYAPRILLRNVEVGETGFGNYGVFGEVKNTGERTVLQLEVTIYALDEAGKSVYEQTFLPVAGEGYIGDTAAPLKPNYARKFGVGMNDAPSDWAKKVKLEITKLELAPAK